MNVEIGGIGQRRWRAALLPGAAMVLVLVLLIGACLPPRYDPRLSQDLVTAISRGDRGAVQSLLARGADPNALTERGGDLPVWSWLYWRVENLRRRPPFKNRVETTALIESVRRGHLDIAKELLARGADPNATDAHGFTALFDASLFGHTEIVRTLLEHGSDVNARSIYGDTILQAAEGRPEIVQMLRHAGAK